MVKNTKKIHKNTLYKSYICYRKGCEGDMKKYMCLISAVLIMSVLILALMRCYNVKKRDNTDISNIAYDEEQILIINRTENYAYGYQDEGIFIDVKGRVYFYCFSQLIYQETPDTDTEFLEKLRDIQKYAAPVMTLEEDVIAQTINLCLDIGIDETYEKELAAYDSGSKTLYVCNGNNMIACRQNGDFEGSLDSISAKKFIEYFDKALLPEITSFCEQMTEEEYASAKAFYYTENALYFENIHCGFLENVDKVGKYVVTNEEELAALEILLGSDFGIREWQTGKAVDCIFFVEAENVSSGGYDLKRKGILCQDGRIEFIPSQDSKVPEEGEMVTEAFDGFVFVAAFPKEVAELFAEQDGEYYLDFKGNAWKHPRLQFRF